MLFFCVTLKLYRLRSFTVPEETDVEASPVQDGGEGESPYSPPEITPLFSVSARLEPLFLGADKRWVCVCVLLWLFLKREVSELFPICECPHNFECFKVIIRFKLVLGSKLGLGV